MTARLPFVRCDLGNHDAVPRSARRARGRTRSCGPRCVNCAQVPAVRAGVVIGGLSCKIQRHAWAWSGHGQTGTAMVAPRLTRGCASHATESVEGGDTSWRWSNVFRLVMLSSAAGEADRDQGAVVHGSRAQGGRIVGVSLCPRSQPPRRCCEVVTSILASADGHVRWGAWRWRWRPGRARGSTSRPGRLLAAEGVSDARTDLVLQVPGRGLWPATSTCR